MTHDLDDQVLIDRLRADFGEATYQRSAGSMAPRSRLTGVGGVVGGLGAVAAATVAATLVAVGGPGTPALAWSPTPSPVTADDGAAARAACSADLTPSDAGSPEREGVPAAVEFPPAELPPLVSLDLRGSGGLATFADADWVVSCLLLDTGDGFERGPVVAERSGSAGTSDSSGGLALISASSTTWSDGRSISMLAGVAPAGATSVEIELPGQPTARADVTDGRFGIWWLGTLDGASTAIRALDTSGTELAAVTCEQCDPSSRSPIQLP
jgi:hypothetical protein